MNDHMDLPSTAAASKVELGTIADEPNKANSCNVSLQSDPTETLTQPCDDFLLKDLLDVSISPLHGSPPLSHNSIGPNNSRDPQHQVGKSFRKPSVGPTFDREMIPHFDERIGTQQDGCSELMGASASICKSGHEDVQLVSDRPDNIPIRSLTIDDEQERRRRVLGTFLDTRFPEIPDIFMNCQQHSVELGESSRSYGNTALGEETDPNAKGDVKNAIERRDSAHRPTSACVADDENETETHAHNPHIGLPISQSMGSDIVRNLDHMPGSSLRTFIDGNDEIGEQASNATRHEGPEVPNSSKNSLAVEPVTPRTPKVSATTNGKAADPTLPESELAQRSVSSLGYNELLLGQTEAQQYDNLIKRGDNQDNTLPNQHSFRDFAEHQTETRELTIDGMKELFRKVNDFNEKMEKQKPCRPRSENVKDSLNRMQKNLNDNFEISEQLFLAASKLRAERAKLDEACRKEKEEIKRLREALRARGHV